MTFKDALNKKYGKNILIDAESFLEIKRKNLRVSPLLDLELGGGVQEGGIMQIAGKKKVGKSSLALQIIGNAHQDYGKEAYIINGENRLSERNLHSTHNLDLKKCTIISSNKEKLLSAQEILNIVEDIAKNEDGAVILLDSISALCPEEEYGKDIALGRAEMPRLLSKFCKRVSGPIRINNCLLILIHHLITNTGTVTYLSEDGGEKIQHASDTKIRAKKFDAWIENGKQIGQVISWDIIWSSLGPPGGNVQSYLRYGYGIDEIKELIKLAQDVNIIKKNGAWYTIKDDKVQGEEKLYNLIKEQNLKQYLLNEIKQVFGI